MQQKPGGMVRHGSRKQVIQVVGNGGLFHQGTPAAFPGLLQVSQARLSGPPSRALSAPFLKSISISSTFFPATARERARFTER